MARNIENTDTSIQSVQKFCLINSLGNEIPLGEETTIFRHQCCVCNPDRAHEAPFHVEIYDNLPELIRLNKLDDIFIFYCVKAKETRNIRIYGKFVFVVEELNNQKISEQIVFELKDDVVSITNNLERDIHIKTIAPMHIYISLHENDSIQISTENSLKLISSIISMAEKPFKNDSCIDVEESDWI